MPLLNKIQVGLVAYWIYVRSGGLLFMFLNIFDDSVAAC